MDKKITIANLRKKISAVEKKRGWNPNAKDLAISIALEVSEVLEYFQWKSSEQVIEEANKNSSKKEELEMEVADVVIYLSQFLDRLNIDLSSAVAKKIKKIDEKYPADKIKSGGDEYYYQQKKRYRQ